MREVGNEISIKLGEESEIPRLATLANRTNELNASRNRYKDVEIEKGLNSTLNTKQKCPYFFKYNPSYSPVEHRELQRDAKTQKFLSLVCF